MNDETAYTMLMSSLPYLGSLFEVRYSVISRIKLDRRLKVLSPEDTQILSKIESVTCWDRLGEIHDDAGYAAQARRLLTELQNPVLLDIVRHRVELRTLVAALRRRHQGRSAPSDGEKWGEGRWLKTIQRNWSDPNFGVRNAFPWVVDAHRLLEEHDSIALERLLLEIVWNELGRKAQGHQFDFVAVVIYVLRWDVMERWTHYQGEVAQERFTRLVDGTIGSHMAAMEWETSHG